VSVKNTLFINKKKLLHNPIIVIMLNYFGVPKVKKNKKERKKERESERKKKNNDPLVSSLQSQF